jgi:hypothetical protein
MKRAIIAGAAVYFGYLEFSNDLSVWLPAWSQTDVWTQVMVLGVLALIVAGSVVWTGYQFLGWIFD